MNLTTVKNMLSARCLELEQVEDRYRANVERPLSVLTQHGGDLIRFDKVLAIDLDPELSAAGLIAIYRESSCAVVPVTSVCGLERKRDDDIRRRTGFV